VLDYGFGDGSVIIGIVRVVGFTGMSRVHADAQADDHVLSVIALIRTEADDAAKAQVVNFDYVHQASSTLEI
jgi:hypothetical protein